MSFSMSNMMSRKGMSMSVPPADGYVSDPFFEASLAADMSSRGDLKSYAAMVDPRVNLEFFGGAPPDASTKMEVVGVYGGVRYIVPSVIGGVPNEALDAVGYQGAVSWLASRLYLKSIRGAQRERRHPVLGHVGSEMAGASVALVDSASNTPLISLASTFPTRAETPWQQFEAPVVVDYQSSDTLRLLYEDDSSNSKQNMLTTFLGASIVPITVEFFGFIVDRTLALDLLAESVGAPCDLPGPEDSIRRRQLFRRLVQLDGGT